MRRDELQYLADSVLIESLFQAEYGLIKHAGLFDELGLAGIGSSIKGFVQSHVRDDAPGGKIGSVLALMTPAIIFRINPLMGALYLVASQIGFDIQSVISKIVSVVKEKLGKGESLTSADVTAIGKTAVAAEAGPETTAAPDDFLEPLRKLSSADGFSKFAQSYGKDEILSKLFGGSKGPGFPKTPWLMGGNGSVINRVFGTLFSLPGGKGKIMWVIGGIIIWTIKTILIGAGLLAGAEAISGLVKKDEKEEVKESTPAPEAPAIQEEHSAPAQVIPAVKSPPVPVNKEIWVVPLVGTIEETLWAWVEDLYPKLSQVPSIKEKVLDSPQFRTIVNQLSDPKKLGKRTLVMPEQFSSRKEVVDLFLKDVK